MTRQAHLDLPNHAGHTALVDLGFELLPLIREEKARWGAIIRAGGARPA